MLIPEGLLGKSAAFLRCDDGDQYPGTRWEEEEEEELGYLAFLFLFFSFLFSAIPWWR